MSLDEARRLCRAVGGLEVDLWTLPVQVVQRARATGRSLPEVAPEVVSAWWIHRCRAGDEGARRSLLELWLPLVMRWCRAHAPSKVEPDDVAHEIMVRASKRLDTLSDPLDVRPWLWNLTRRTLRARSPAAVSSRRVMVPPPSSEEVSAAWYRLCTHLDAPCRPHRGWRILAVIIALTVGVGTSLWHSPIGAPTPDRAVGFLPNGSTVVTQGVSVTANGDGRATVDGARTRVDWRTGRVLVDVDPAAGRAVVVTTPEAEISVLGTRFVVERGTFGTETRVVHGHVALACSDGAGPSVLSAGETAWCFRHARAGLGQVQWMEHRGADAGTRLTVIERALGHPHLDEATRVKLRHRQVDAYASLGRVANAVAAARTLPGWRRTMVLSDRARAAMTKGGCGAAEPWLLGLAESGDVTGTLMLVQCLADHAPVQAHQLLDSLATRPLDDETSVAVRVWQQAIDEPPQ